MEDTFKASAFDRDFKIDPNEYSGTKRATSEGGSSGCMAEFLKWNNHAKSSKTRLSRMQPPRVGMRSTEPFLLPVFNMTLL